jgi:hypothetical protein
LKLFQLTQKIVYFYQQLKKIQIKIVAANFTADSLITEIYPDFLAELPIIYSEIKILDSRNQFISKTLVNKIGKDLAQIQDETHLFFVNWIEKIYQGKVSFLTKALPQSQYPFQIIHQYKNNPPGMPVYVLIFDGMRWDGWQLLQPRIFSVFKNRKIEYKPVLAPLSTITSTCRPFLLTGHFTHSDERSFLQSVYDTKNVAVHFHKELADLYTCLDQTEPKNLLQIINFDLFDRRIHHAKLGLKMIYREILQEFEETIEPALLEIPADSLIILFSDHGFIQVTGKWFQQLKYDFQPDIPVYHRRYLPLEANKADKKHFIFKSNTELGRGEEENQGVAFLRKPAVFKFAPSESYTRYAHGGISLEEMVVPVVVIHPE